MIQVIQNQKNKNTFRGLIPRANYTDCRLWAKLLRTSVSSECHVLSVTDPHGRILGFLDWSRYFLFQVAPQLYLGG
jgi:hypothetical protein